MIEEWVRGLTTWQAFFAALGGLLAVIGGLFARPFRFTFKKAVGQIVIEHVKPIEDRLAVQEARIEHLRGVQSARAVEVNRLFASIRSDYGKVEGGLASVSEDIRAGSRRLEVAMTEIAALQKDVEARLRIQDDRFGDLDERLSEVEAISKWRTTNGSGR